MTDQGVKGPGDVGGLGMLARRSEPVSVFIGIQDPGLHQEVLDFLGRHPGLTIAGSTSDTGQLAGHPASDPAVQVLCPLMASRLVGPSDGQARLRFVIGQELSVANLRVAIHAGARGVFEWPAERDQLAETLAGVRTAQVGEGSPRGRVIAVVGARGGAGVTFVATHLAAAFADRGDRPVLVDADPAHSDLTAALGVLPADGARTILDLLPVIGELSPDHLEDVLFRHPRGFSVLLGPDFPEDDVKPGLYRGAVALLALAYDPVVVHVARPSEPSARNVVALADAVVLVTALDLLSIYGARRAIAGLGLGDRPEGCFAVMNRAGRSPLGRKDVERLLGMSPTAFIRPDARIPRVQERGRLLPGRARGAARDVLRLANLVAPNGRKPARRGTES